MYLSDEELRNGYDEIMKQVEHGTSDWEDNLERRLNDHFVFRVNVNLRNKIENGSFNRAEPKGEKFEAKFERNDTERVIYCQEFNKKSCIHPDHHEGRFMNKKITKWHVCNKCLIIGEKRSHPSIDCSRGSS